jgi:hypothetical protein
MLAIAGEPNGVTPRSILSPATTATREESLQVCAAPAIEHVRAVEVPFLSTVSVQLAPPPAAAVTFTRRSLMVEEPGGSGISTGPSVAETIEEPHARYESLALSASAPAPANTVLPRGPTGGGEGLHGIGP